MIKIICTRIINHKYTKISNIDLFINVQDYFTLIPLTNKSMIMIICTCTTNHKCTKISNINLFIKSMSKIVCTCIRNHK